MMNSGENRPLLTAEIVSKFVAHHKLDPGQPSDLIATVHRTISRLSEPDKPEAAHQQYRYVDQSNTIMSSVWIVATGARHCAGISAPGTA